MKLCLTCESSASSTCTELGHETISTVDAIKIAKAVKGFTREEVKHIQVLIYSELSVKRRCLCEEHSELVMQSFAKDADCLINLESKVAILGMLLKHI